jgi:hypothetical protein
MGEAIRLRELLLPLASLQKQLGFTQLHRDVSRLQSLPYRAR